MLFLTYGRGSQPVAREPLKALAIADLALDSRLS